MSVPAGLLNLNKPIRMSSMQAVAAVRRRIERPPGVKRVKVGHAGTLDPLATGVLVIAVGQATKSIPRFMNTPKRYETTINLSAFTETDDAEGDLLPVEVGTPPTQAEIADALARQFGAEGGTIMQTPPAYSAMKVGGRRAYALARKGEAVDIPARRVVVHGISLLDLAWPRLTLDVRCGKGFYIRSLARALGVALNTGGFCERIHRTAVGGFTVNESWSLDSVPDPLTDRNLIAVDDAIAMVT